MLERCELYFNISRVQGCNMCIVSLKACARNKLFRFKISKTFNGCMYFKYDSSFFPRIWWSKLCSLIFSERMLGFFLLHKFSYTKICARLEWNSSRTLCWEYAQHCQKCEEAITQFSLLGSVALLSYPGIPLYYKCLLKVLTLESVH